MRWLKYLFTYKYRIKKIATPQLSGGHMYRYRLQHRLPWAWWVSDYWDADENKVREKMREYKFNAKRKKNITYFYNADSMPEHVPSNQKDRYYLAKEKKEKEGK